MADLNTITLVGRLGQEPELRVAGQGENQFSVVNFSIANNQFNGKEEVGHWFRVEVTGKTAEYVDKNFSKGDKVLVNGTLKTNTYKNGDGKDVTITFIKAFTVVGMGAPKPKTQSQPQEQVQAQPYEQVQAQPYEPFEDIVDISF